MAKDLNKETDYNSLLLQTIAVIEQARTSVARFLTNTATSTYWAIGRLLYEKKLDSKHGGAVVRRLSVDLKDRYPELGTSTRNLWYMKQFYERYHNTDLKVQRSVALLPWKHNILIMSKRKKIILINLKIIFSMSTRANIFIRESQTDRDKEVLYHHCDGYPEGVGRYLTRILGRLPKDENGEVLKEFLNKRRMAEFICEQDKDFSITTPYSAGDSEFDYEIDLERRRVDWYATSWTRRRGERDWLCDF